MSRPLALAGLVAVGLLAGCGTTGSTSASSASAASGSRPEAPGARAATGAKRVRLRQEVELALRGNHRLALLVLWSDALPAGAGRSTRGPALAAMEASARERAREQLRVRSLAGSYRILSIRVDRSGSTATALVQWDQELVPSRLDGAPLGRPVALDERARIELRRRRRSARFFVWHLTLQQ